MKPCGCRNVESCHKCIPSAGLWLTLGVVGTLAALSVGAKKGGSRSEHPWYALSRWESGELARTRTRDTFPVGAGRLDPEENPTGPDSRDRRPSTAGELFGEGLAGLAPWALAALALWAWSSRGRR
ncbi:MAG: hypothetical protein EBU84_21755 [Actinobacteria bacterium]|nr:hypothetical protein [Actinomycetota bacterium]